MSSLNCELRKFVEEGIPSDDIFASDLELAILGIVKPSIARSAGNSSAGR